MIGSVSKMKRAIKAADFPRLKALVEKGADPGATFNDFWNEGIGGISMLHLAAHVGAEEIISYLIEKGADLNARDNNLRTPLHAAARNGQTGAAAVLLKAGADANLRDKAGATPVQRAKSYQNHETALLLERYTEDPVSHYGLVEKQAPVPVEAAPQPPAAAPLAPPEWSLVNETLVARSVTAEGLGYRLTDIFDFHSRERIRIVQNLETRQDKVATTAFSDIAEKTALHAAFEALTRLGGKAEPPIGMEKTAKLATPKGGTP